MRTLAAMMILTCLLTGKAVIADATDEASEVKDAFIRAHLAQSGTDLDAERAAIVGADDRYWERARMGIQIRRALEELDRVVIEQFGEEAADVYRFAIDSEPWIQTMAESAEVAIDGDLAVLTLEVGLVFEYVKVDGVWKQRAEMLDDEEHKRVMTVRSAALEMWKGLIQDTSDGRFSGVEELFEAVIERMIEQQGTLEPDETMDAPAPRME